MKNTILFFVMSLFFIPVFAQDAQTGLPGDNLNLYGVMNLFQQSPTLEEFEKNLNAPDSQINNLDLNADGQIDYIHVVDNPNGNAHAIALRVDINDQETQDVAVIEVDKDANNQTQVEIVGDEALYGKNYIVVPNQNTPNPAYTGGVAPAPATPYYAPDTWAIIGSMYTPSYVVYASPFHWGYYPHYWHPWRPVGWDVYYGYQRPYYHDYRRTYTYYSPRVHEYYAPHRVVSTTVRARYPEPRREPDRRFRNDERGHSPAVRPVNRGGEQPVYRREPNSGNRAPRPVNNSVERTNQTPRAINNNPVRTNTAPRPINSNPQPINHNTQPINSNTHPVQNQPQRTINNNQNRTTPTPHPTNNQNTRSQQQPRQNTKPAQHNQSQPRSTQGKKAEEPRK